MTGPSWPASVATTLPVAASHSRAVLSRDAVATSRPSGEKATAQTMASWPAKGGRSHHTQSRRLRQALSRATCAEDSRGNTRWIRLAPDWSGSASSPNRMAVTGSLC